MVMKCNRCNKGTINPKDGMCSNHACGIRDMGIAMQYKIDHDDVNTFQPSSDSLGDKGSGLQGYDLVSQDECVDIIRAPDGTMVYGEVSSEPGEWDNAYSSIPNAIEDKSVEEPLTPLQKRIERLKDILTTCQIGGYNVGVTYFSLARNLRYRSLGSVIVKICWDQRDPYELNEDMLDLACKYVGGDDFEEFNKLYRFIKNHTSKKEK